MKRDEGKTRAKHNYNDHYDKAKKLRKIARELNAKFNLKG